MTVHAWLSLLVCVVGALVYVAADPQKHPKAMELARLSFACGLLAWLMANATKVITLP